MAEERKTIETMMTSTEDDLLRALGAILSGGEVDRDDRSRRSAERARNWLRRHSDSIRALLCPKLATFDGDAVDLVVAIAALLSQSLIKDDGAITVGILIAKRGLDAFCSSGSTIW